MMSMVKGCVQKACDAMPFGSSSAHKAAQEDVMLQDILASNPVVIFGKTTCPYCSKAKSIFQEMGAVHYDVELDQLVDGAGLARALKRRTHQRTVPNIFIGERHIGGFSGLERIRPRLKDLLKEAGALS